MPKLSQAKDGKALTIAHQSVRFSYWPSVKGVRRAKLQPRIFTSDPWALIAEGIADKCPKQSRDAALGFRAQAEDFYDAVVAMGNRNIGAKPLLLYYSFLNLGKAYLATKGRYIPGARPSHGISERARVRQVEGTRLTVYPSVPKTPQLFAQLYEAITGNVLVRKRYYRLGSLMPQILFGHRVWCSAANESERFLSIKDIQYIDNREDREAWIRLQIDKEELAKLHLSQEDALKRSRLAKNWHFVEQPERKFQTDFCIEQLGNTPYTDRPSDTLLDLTKSMRPYLWTSVLLHPPYRKYYLYLSPQSERNSVLPQLLSMYLIVFLLGSITRYQPDQFDRLLDTRYGAHLIGAMSEIRTQYLYLMASELLEREVTRASLA